MDLQKRHGDQKAEKEVERNWRAEPRICLPTWEEKLQCQVIPFQFAVHPHVLSTPLGL